MEKILLFGTKPADTLLVKKLADNMRIAVQEVPVSLYDCTIEQLLAVKGVGIIGVKHRILQAERRMKCKISQSAQYRQN